MSIEIKVPSVGESITEGVVSRWLKKNGELVRADEPVVELETEKATTELTAPATGKLIAAVAEGTTVSIGAVLGRIEESDGSAAAVPRRDSSGDGKADKHPPVAVKEPAPQRPPEPATARSSAPAAGSTQAPLSPAARHMVEEKGMNAEQIAGTGRGGRITKEDVLVHIESDQSTGSRDHRTPSPGAMPLPPPSPQAAVRELPSESMQPTGSRETRQRMSAIRLRIADRLVASQKSTATLTTFNEADMSAVIALREEFKDRFREKHEVSLGFMSFFVKAVVKGLREFPQLNARIDGPDIVSQHYYNIGVAVSTEKGLIVPVLHDADRMIFAQIEKQLAELVKKAREGKIAVADLQGGTFTITNGGVFGSLLSTPILNPPQVAILGMHTIQKRPVALGDQVLIRPMMYLALSYDHRLIDGREAVLFLIRVKECIENPARLFLEI
jgi:2-oxoglutarate dehydrogenase E2 component (dihydrolipoamide succinyltransferase)